MSHRHHAENSNSFDNIDLPKEKNAGEGILESKEKWERELSKLEFTPQEIEEFVKSNQGVFLYHKKQEKWEQDLNEMLTNLANFRGEPLSDEEKELFRMAANNVANLEDKN